MNQIPIEGTWSNEQAAAFLGCSPLTLKVWVSKRKIPFVKVNRLTRFLRCDLEEFLRQNTVPAER